MMWYSENSLNWLNILSVKGIAACRWVRLAGELAPGAISEMLGSESGRGELGRLLGRKVIPPGSGVLEGQMAAAERVGCSMISISDKGYPKLLKEIADPPPLLFWKGDLTVLDGPAVCLVGSRSASRRGILFSRNLARALSDRGYTVVSGLARGIDSAAHEGALEGGRGTAAVLGCGLDVPYPPENASLAIDIAGNGCLLSELPLGTPPFKYNFPRRNRILSGLSLGIAVVEAGLCSGAMGTARWAVEQNRDVFAVPGPVEKPGSRGPHLLIKEGAYLIEGVEDIAAVIPCGTEPFSGAGSGTGGGADSELNDLEQRVYTAMELDPKHIDELVQICNISAMSILPVLLNLEMRGLIESCGGGTYALAADSGGHST